jgi:hypothetical protein
MDKQVEMLIIGIVGAVAIIGLLVGQFNIVSIIVAGLIGFLSHGIIAPETTVLEDQPLD